MYCPGITIIMTGQLFPLGNIMERLWELAGKGH